jgi:hypothetical protein
VKPALLGDETELSALNALPALLCVEARPSADIS